MPVAGVGLILAGILLVAVNLRAAITSLGALLPEVSQGLHLSPTAAGFITTLPALCFAAFGTITPALTRRLPIPAILIGAMLVLGAGQAVRAVTGSTIIFVITSTLALGGIAVGNVLLPAVVRQTFPERSGLITGVYTMTLIAGTAAASAASVPIAHAFGGWRAGLGAWAALSFIAMLPWFGRSFSGTKEKQTKIRVAKSKLAWAMAVYFGLQSLSGYATMGWLAQMFRDAGFSPSAAGLLLAGVPFFGMPIALLMPALAGRRANPRGLVLVLAAAMIASYLGLALSPGRGAVVWAVLWVALLALGQGAFPFALAMIGMRARTPQGIVALSTFAQSTGYVIAALGPLVVGVLYEATGGWTLPLGFLLAAAVIQAVVGLIIARPRYLEDELAKTVVVSRPSHPPATHPHPVS
ncbi:MAG TPA: MFS transporter [Candidatus Limnocylindrales bacterium]|nr:MFS transporter [Candidatus Limnocylindrales bacterium]